MGSYLLDAATHTLAKRVTVTIIGVSWNAINDRKEGVVLLEVKRG